MADAADTITVFAAASLKNALDEIAEAFTQATGQRVRLSFAGSSALARQIEHGAPADLFISANRLWMDVLEAQGRIDPASRIDLLSNTLVLIAHGGSGERIEIGHGFDLEGLLGDRLLAMALVDAVPVGIYGKAALASLGLWPSLAGKVAQTDNARSALRLVASGEAGLGIVYASDALAEDNVSVIGSFPAYSHPPIVYPAAAVASEARAARFLAYLQESTARSVFERHGFAVLAGLSS